MTGLALTELMSQLQLSTMIKNWKKKHTKIRQTIKKSQCSFEVDFLSDVLLKTRHETIMNPKKTNISLLF
jgi:hypothetical protein